MEWRLFDGAVAEVSTSGFHEHRERAPHLEQPVHRDRLLSAAGLVREASTAVAADRGHGPTEDGTAVRVVDLGCGDGGLLSLLADNSHIDARGYDFQPSNAAGWAEREVRAEALNFVQRWEDVAAADVYVLTEVLEHLTDPHRLAYKVFARGAHLVCSSPWTETDRSHDACHAWAWDQNGYAAMIYGAGFTIRQHLSVGMFQLVWAVPA